jgi:hypothetical protein
MKLTPKDITNSNLYYSIPIYQRLFEWDTENIVTLLDDLKKAFSDSDGDDDYYIGMLTSTSSYELVDGQQRFTAMMLIGCVLQNYSDDSTWKKFLYNEHSRLKFTSRPSDDAYLQNLIELSKIDNVSACTNDDFCNHLTEKSSYVNSKMLDGITRIFKYLKEELPDDKRNDFATYVYNHLCFFISELPEGYGPSDLNRYFERMNTSGKNLEQHEILKVKLLSNLSSNISVYMMLWNKLSDVDSPLIRKHKGEDEVSFRRRKKEAFQSTILSSYNNNLINGLNNINEENSLSIDEVPMSSEEPSEERVHIRESRSALTFPYLLLQTLYWQLDKQTRSSITNKDFFKPNDLLTIFSKYLPFDGNRVDKKRILDFMERLFKCRLALDICFVRITEDGYLLDMNLPEGDDDDIKNRLMMLESMLYVSSSNYTHYRWFGWLMNYLQKCNGIPSAADLYKELKQRDDSLHKQLPQMSELEYGNDNRYWFWRLDFYIWKHKEDIFSGKENVEFMNVANNYVFKRNRSIEHVAPQTPESTSRIIWDDTDEDRAIRDSFGNTVMISQGLNSALSNESYEVKRAHVESFVRGSKSGTIESLKLLIIYKDYKSWDKENIRNHGEQMYKMLKKSYEE